VRYAQAVRQQVERHPFRGAEEQPDGKVTVSAGIAVFPTDASSDEALIKAADMNLYQAKEAGRNTVVDGSR